MGRAAPPAGGRARPRAACSRTRRPTPEELRATLVVRLPIEEGSAKVRSGGPVDDEADLALDHWAGVIPLQLVRGEPVADD